MEGTDSDGMSFLMHGASGVTHRHPHPGLRQATAHQRQRQGFSTQRWQQLTHNQQQQQPAPQQRQQFPQQQRQQFPQQQRQEATQHPQQDRAQQQQHIFVPATAADPPSPGQGNTQARQVHQPPSPGNTSTQVHPVRQPVRLQGIPKEKQLERGTSLLRDISKENHPERRPNRLGGISEESKTDQGEDNLPPPRPTNWHESDTSADFPPEGSDDTLGYSAERWRGASVNRAISQDPQAEKFDDPMAALLRRGKGMMDPSLVVFKAAWSMVEDVLWKEQVRN